VVALPKQHYSFDRSIIAGVEGRLTQSDDTLDTWFSSGLWPFSIMGRPESMGDMDMYYPNSVLETGYDIIFFRVIRMMIMAAEMTGKPPFADVYMHGLVRDEKGRKMSKSLGNVVNPVEIIEQYGADSLRLSLLAKSTPGTDVNYSDSNTQYYSRFVNKLRNASRFTTSFGISDDPGIAAVWNDIEALQKQLLTRDALLSDFDLRALHVLNELIYEVDKLT
jgi:valyl-tRNA synthetase